MRSYRNCETIPKEVNLPMDTFEYLQLEREVYAKLQQAQEEAQQTHIRYTAQEVLAAMEEAIWEENV